MVKMKYGYCRVSTTDQSYKGQVERLMEFGVAKDCIRVEKVSGKSMVGRDELTTLLSVLRDGDTLVCTKLDRLGRSVRDVENIVGELEEKGVGLIFTDQQIDTSTPTGKCFLQMLSVFSEFERNMISTRQMDGIARAKLNGGQLGRKPSIDRRRLMELRNEGMNPTQIAREMGINRGSVYRLEKELTAPLSAS